MPVKYLLLFENVNKSKKSSETGAIVLDGMSYRLKDNRLPNL